MASKKSCAGLCPCIKCFFTYFGRWSICFPFGLCSDKYKWLLTRKGGKEDGK